MGRVGPRVAACGRAAATRRQGATEFPYSHESDTRQDQAGRLGPETLLRLPLRRESASVRPESRRIGPKSDRKAAHGIGNFFPVPFWCESGKNPRGLGLVSPADGVVRPSQSLLRSEIPSSVDDR